MKAPSGEISPKEFSILTAIDNHMNGTSTLETTSSALAKPIEEDYSNGGHTSGGYVAGYTPDNPDDPPSICTLYSSILRYARTIPWDDSAAHFRLIALLDAFWVRPEPPNPPGENGVMWHSGWWVSFHSYPVLNSPLVV